MTTKINWFWPLATVIIMLTSLLLSFPGFAHDVDAGTKQFLQSNDGVALIPFLYIGAKHMVTGYDHLLFLVGVLFFLYRSKDVLIYVSLFTLGHSVTLLFGVLNNIQVNSYMIDAIIGLSVVYKGFDNLGGFKTLFGFQPNTKAAVLIFGLFHGFGLASKLQDFEFGQDGLMQNLIAFNVGVELGQILALTFVLILLGFWRRFDSYIRFATVSNSLLMSGGFMLILYQLTGYVVG
ncbi:MAG: hypothetical protein ACI8WB_000769 [Phenylobacterium sp.]|jgi:hypothetical protein